MAACLGVQQAPCSAVPWSSCGTSKPRSRSSVPMCCLRMLLKVESRVPSCAAEVHLLTACALPDQAGDLQQRALQAMQADARLQSRLGRSISLGYAGGCALCRCMPPLSRNDPAHSALEKGCWHEPPLLPHARHAGGYHCMRAFPGMQHGLQMRDACWAGQEISSE